jgi:hypothetical protein
MAEELHPDLYAGEGLVEEEQIIEERTGPAHKAFDARSLQEPIHALPFASPLLVTRTTSVAEAIRLMQEQHMGCVLV